MLYRRWICSGSAFSSTSVGHKYPKVSHHLHSSIQCTLALQGELSRDWPYSVLKWSSVSVFVAYFEFKFFTIQICPLADDFSNSFHFCICRPLFSELVLCSSVSLTHLVWLCVFVEQPAWGRQSCHSCCYQVQMSFSQVQEWLIIFIASAKIIIFIRKSTSVELRTQV
jgi:hypothetical protein